MLIETFFFENYIDQTKLESGDETKTNPDQTNPSSDQANPSSDQSDKDESKHRAIENWMKGHMDQIEEEESEVSGDFGGRMTNGDPFDGRRLTKKDPFEGSQMTNGDPFVGGRLTKEDPFGKKSSAEMLERRIELVETDDCTSLDTTVKV